METIGAINLSVTECPPLIMRDLSEFATLVFLAAFNVQMTSEKSDTPEAYHIYRTMEADDADTRRSVHQVPGSYLH